MKIKTRPHVYTVCVLFALALSSIFPVPAKAVDVEYSEAYNNSTVVKVVDGIRFQVPEDRPILKDEGFIRPMPLDEYVSMKFSKLENRLQKMERSIEEIKKDIAATAARLRMDQAAETNGKTAQKIMTDGQISEPAYRQAGNEPL